MPADPQQLLAPAPTRHKHTLLIAFAGFALGIALASVWFGGTYFQAMKEDSGAGAASSTESNVLSNVSAGIVSVHDQRAGDTVLVDSVNVPAPGVWVAVEEIREDDLGNVLGAARALGPVADIPVSLLRATTPGHTYAIVLYRDDGDGVFDLHGDSVYVDFASGKRVIALFSTDI